MEKIKLAYFLLPFLGWNTITDLKEGRISFLSVLFFGALGIVLLLCPMGKDLLCQNGSIYVHVLGAGIGLLMLLISVATGGGIGGGDGIVAVVLGWYLGIWQVLLLFLFAFFSAGLLGGALLLLKKAGRKSRLPMLPFLLLSYVFLLASGLL